MSTETPATNPAAPNQPVVEQKSNAFLDWLKGNWLALLLIILSIVFIAQNTDEVRVNLLWTSVTAPLWLLFLLLLLIGVLSGLIMARRRAKKKELAAGGQGKRKRK